MRAAIKKLQIRVGRVVRDIERQLVGQSEHIKAAFSDALAMATRLLNQKHQFKNKLYSIHVPETECISKGKAHKRYEFGVEVSFAATNFLYPLLLPGSSSLTHCNKNLLRTEYCTALAL